MHTVLEFSHPCLVSPYLKMNFFLQSPITNQNTQRQTETEAIAIIRQHGRCEHSIANWDRTAFLHPSMFWPYIVLNECKCQKPGMSIACDVSNQLGLYQARTRSSIVRA